MSHKTKVHKALTGVILIVCSLGVATTAFGRSTKDVKLEIDNNQLKVISKKNANGCSWLTSRGPGCIKVDKRDQADIDFKLTGDAKCTLEYGTEWELSELYLGGYNASSKPAAPGFASTGQADFNKVDSDFHGVDKNTGFVKSATVDPKKITVADENQHKYVVWYTIKATCKREDGEDPYETFTDPRVRNGGTD